jgi:hypothetical protein
MSVKARMERVFEKARTPGAKDVKPRKRRSYYEHGGKTHVINLGEEDIKRLQGYVKDKTPGYSRARKILGGLEKARPHKYIRRLGQPGKYEYIYRPEQDGLVWDKEGGMFVRPEVDHPKMIVKDPDRVSSLVGEYGKALHEPTYQEMEHEEMRIGTMSEKALSARVKKVKDPQKMLAFAHALDQAGYHDMAGECYDNLKLMGYTSTGGGYKFTGPWEVKAIPKKVSILESPKGTILKLFKETEKEVKATKKEFAPPIQVKPTPDRIMQYVVNKREESFDKDKWGAMSLDDRHAQEVEWMKEKFDFSGMSKDKIYKLGLKLEDDNYHGPAGYLFEISGHGWKGLPEEAKVATPPALAGDKTKNLASKMRPLENPYEVWKSSDGWEWRVLKKYQSPDKEATNPYARWMCAVRSPMTQGSWDYGDTYVKDVMKNAVKVQSGDFRNAEPPEPKLPKGDPGRRIDIGQDEYEKSFRLEEPFEKSKSKRANLNKGVFSVFSGSPKGIMVQHVDTDEKTGKVTRGNRRLLGGKGRGKDKQKRKKRGSGNREEFIGRISKEHGVHPDDMKDIWKRLQRNDAEGISKEYGLHTDELPEIKSKLKKLFGSEKGKYGSATWHEVTPGHWKSLQIEEPFEKARTKGAKDIKKRKRHSWAGSSENERKRMLAEVGVTVHEGLIDKEWKHLPDDVQNRLFEKEKKSWDRYYQQAGHLP